MTQVVLFWFYKDPDVVTSRVSLLRHFNPDIQILGLYGGPPSEYKSFSQAADRFDDVWVHPYLGSDWMWRNGDLAIVNWFKGRGQGMSWSQVLVHQWDLLTTRPLREFALRSQREVLLTGVRPLEEVSDRWVWVQSWSDHRSNYEAFRSHPLIRGQPEFASIFVLSAFSYDFLTDYAQTATGVPGFVEYRLPTLANILGYRFASCNIHPDWDTSGDPLINGCGREVTLEQVRARLGSDNVRVWHPVRTIVTPCDLIHGTLETPTAPRTAILQITPAREGEAAGGSQVVAIALARSMREAGHDVTIFCGSEDHEAVVWKSDGIEYRTAFPIAPQLMSNGVADIEYFEGQRGRVDACDIVFMIDRIFPVAEHTRAVLILGTTAYSFARDAVLSPAWAQLISPSLSVARQLVSWLAEAGMGERASAVYVIPNPVVLPNAHGERAATRNGPFKLLFPHRADSGKGLGRCLHLLAQLNRTTVTELIVIVDASPTAEPGFYDQLRSDAERLSVERRIRFVPWQGRSRMAALYQRVDLTLCLGEIREGFGLVCMESILAGTPVLVKIGNHDGRILPPRHGCVFADTNDIVEVALNVLTRDYLKTDIERGRLYINERYSISVFQQRLGEFLKLTAERPT